nr:hypothetical protein [uncultured bacterium]
MPDVGRVSHVFLADMSCRAPTRRKRGLAVEEICVRKVVGMSVVEDATEKGEPIQPQFLLQDN